MAEDKNKNKERLQDQSEHNPSNQNQQDGDKIHLDPAKKSLQADDTKVQNPNRNLAQGGNNTRYDKK